MYVRVIYEAGYDAALFGLGFSKGVTSQMPAIEFLSASANMLEEYEQMERVAQTLAPMNNGHNKFLYQMPVWIDVVAPRYWWQEADQYKFVVTQSESTMHTIHKQPFTQEMFEDGDVPECILELLNKWRKDYLETRNFTAWKNIIKFKPESFLQRRLFYTNYRTLRDIIKQRTGHRLSEWGVFIEEVRKHCEHQELLA